MGLIGECMNYDEESKLRGAVLRGDLEYVKAHAAQAPNDLIDNLLLLSCRDGYLDLVKYLVEEQAGDLDADFTEDVPGGAFILAFQEGNNDIIQYILYEQEFEFGYKTTNWLEQYEPNSLKLIEERDMKWKLMEDLKTLHTKDSTPKPKI